MMMNLTLGDAAVGLITAGVILLAARNVWRTYRGGGCGCGCSGCDGRPGSAEGAGCPSCGIKK